MSTDIHHLRTEYSYRAIHGWIGLVKRRHDPSDGRLLLDQVNLMASVGQIQRCLDTGNAAANDQGRLGDRHLGLDLRFQITRPGDAASNEILGLSVASSFSFW